ncbi:protoporphyrinogen oxidase HemJ [Candidatus Marinarcus aquaticus]|uniref:Protoporphyrinogen IX oxidase n=1 Tax=Candidatus Marinarcus aquaticus TaxID=2044504 RepID=A0A4Q0XQF4_9BACT|nr:protoporphyrinogen oxidase HemJ [Candidatus Marinarcus aquaticus]RXJ57989.1 TIGR00701 family protein [Candidatus Marinarcus aquaticus]
MEYYTWILTFHVMSFMSWMAMLFYLPRLFVYHVEYKDKKEFVEVVEIQEEKIYNYIGHPAMWATFLSGAWMLYLNPSVLQGGGWMHAKIFVVTFLIMYSLSLNYFRKELKANRCTKDGKFFRAYNEVPTLFALLIVGYVITKTFSFLFTLIAVAIFAFIGYKILTKKEKA